MDSCSKDDSKFIHSIGSHMMVKNLCASQEYFQWDIFLTFTCNMRKHFGTKPICECLDDNEWSIHFPNCETYSFFQQQEIKRYLNQSALGYLYQFGKKSELFLLIISAIVLQEHFSRWYQYLLTKNIKPVLVIFCIYIYLEIFVKFMDNNKHNCLI